jgi:hypothetical protein
VRFENYCVATAITKDERKKALLLHYAGKRVHEVYMDIAGTDDNYDACKKLLSDHFQPKVNVEFEIHNFRHCNQMKKEKFEQCIVRLRAMASTCEFSNKDSEIKQQLITGCQSHSLRLKLLSDTCDLKKALELGRAYELSDEQSRVIEAKRDGPLL